MNENLNLVEILKDCPKGTKLYSTVFGEVELIGIGTYNNPIYEIEFRAENGVAGSVTSDGKHFDDFDGECTLFPSRGERNWANFKPKKEDFVPHCKFKDGDIMATALGSQVFILKREKSNRIGYCYIGYDFKNHILFPAGIWAFSRLATEEEKRKFFDAIKLNGYKWNAEAKTLEKSVKSKFKVGDKIVFAPMKYMGGSRAKGTISEITDDKYIFTDGRYISISNQDSWGLAPDKFDPKTLKPFDKVLEGVKHDGAICWRIDLFSHIIGKCIYLMGGVGFRVIPYNEETKHLVGTAEEAPEYYRYWED